MFNMFSVYSYFYSLTPRYLIKVIGTDLGWLMMFGWCWRSDQYELYQVYQVSAIQKPMKARSSLTSNIYFPTFDTETQ